MKATLLTKQYNRLLSQRNHLLVVLTVASLLSLLLAAAVLCLIGKKRTIIVPPTFNQAFWLDSNTVSDSYLEQMSRYFAGLLLNVTPNSFANQSEHLLQHVAAENFAIVKAQLLEQQKEITDKAISTTFHITHFKIDRKHLWVELKGELKVLMANAQVISKTKTYQLKFDYKQGQLYLQSFNEVLHV